MESDRFEIEYRTNLLYNMLSASHGLNHWVYDGEGNLVSTDSEDSVLDVIFTTTKCKQAMLDYAQESDMPILLGAPVGLNWIAAFEKHEDKLYRAHVLGPAMHMGISDSGIRRAIEQFQVPLDWKSMLVDLLLRLPVVSATSMIRAGVMLHYSITAEKISTVDIHMEFHQPPSADPVEDRRDRHRTWMVERQLLDQVRQGNLNTAQALTNARAVSSGIQVRTDTPVEQARISIIVFISLCTRAAMEGGVLPDIAYTTGDGYIQEAQNCESVAGLTSIGDRMYSHFIRLVHEKNKREDLSKVIQATIEYINLHIEDELALTVVAKRMGYAEYYLSRKFKQEMGVSFKEYLRVSRIERAKLLLTTTDDSLQQIATRLPFANKSYFSVVFKEVAGIPPAQYREENSNV